jgi:hypothetical protein
MLFALIIVAAFSPPAKAGLIDQGTAGGARAYNGCAPAGCAWTSNVASTRHLELAPGHSSTHTYKAGSSASINVDPPAWGGDAWGGQPDGYMIHVNFRLDGVTNLGSNWELAICGPNGGCPITYRTGGAVEQNMPIYNPEQPVTLVMRYIGTGQTIGSSTTTIRSRVQIQWIAIDNTPPSVVLSANDVPAGVPVNFNATVATNGKISVGVDSVGDNTQIASGVVLLNDRPVGGLDGTYTVGNGVTKLSAHVCDVASNCVDPAITVGVDSGLPIVNVLNPTMVFNTTTPTISIGASDTVLDGWSSGLAGARLRLGDQFVDAAAQKVPGGFTIQPTLQEGRYAWAVQVWDNFGNFSEDTDPTNLFVDITPATITPAAPTPGTVYDASTSVPTTLTANVTDTVGVKAAGVTFDGVAVESEPPDQAEMPTTFTITGSIEGTQCPGDHQIVYTAVDVGDHVVTLPVVYKVKGRLTGQCRRIACNHAKAAYTQVNRSYSSAVKNRRKLGRQLASLRHQSHLKGKRNVAKRAAANAKIPVVRGQYTTAHQQVKDLKKQLRPLRSRRSRLC